MLINLDPPLTVGELFFAYQGVLGDSEKVKWRGTWVVKTIIKKQIDFPVKMLAYILPCP